MRRTLKKFSMEKGKAGQWMKKREKCCSRRRTIRKWENDGNEVLDVVADTVGWLPGGD